LSSFRQPIERIEWRLEQDFDLMPSLEPVRHEAVEVHRLDSVVSELHGVLPADSRFFLKMDTQGFDLEVFEGALGCVDRVAGLQSEVSFQPLYKGMPSADESLRVFRAAGFIESAYFPVHVDARMRAVEMDCIMVRS
jgi:hypothetical protein